jgi:mRNA-decapping enzyme subunit 2
LRPLNPLLPSLSQRHFTQLIISSSPFYSSLAGDEGVDYDSVWAEYISYKSMVPCCGGILINSVGDKASLLDSILLQGFRLMSTVPDGEGMEVQCRLELS